MPHPELSTEALSLAELRAALATERAARQVAEARLAALAAPASAVLPLLTDNLPLAVLLTDAAGRIVLLNRHYVEWFAVAGGSAGWLGRPMAELLEHVLPAFMGGDMVLEQARELLANRQGTLGELLPMHDGRVLERDTIWLPEGGWLVCYRDVTEREAARQAQQQAEARMAQVVREVRAGLLLVDDSDRVLVINQRYCDLFGLAVDPAELVGSTGQALLTYVSHLYPDPVARRTQVLAQRAAGQNVFGEVLPLTDGRVLERDYIILDGTDGGYVGQLACYRDVTERESAHRARQRADARVELLLRELRVGLLLTDSLGSPQLVNDYFSQVLGLAPGTSAELVGLSWKQAATQLSQAFARPVEALSWSRVAPRGGIALRNIQLTLRDGRIVEIDARPLPEADGGWLLAVRDVTERERTEARLRTVSRVSEQNPNPIVRLAADGRVLYANPAAQLLESQLSPEQQAGLHERNQRLVAQALGQGAAGQPWQLESQLGDFWYQAFVVPVPAERYVNLYLVDVTARRAVEQLLDEQRLFYETILDYLPGDVAVFDGELRYRYLNPQAQADAEMRRWLMGRSWEDYYTRLNLPRARADQRYQVLTQARATGRLVAWDEELPNPAGGAPRLVRRHLQPVPDPSGVPYLLIGYGVDVTEVRQAQRQVAEQRTFYETILNNLPSDVAVLDEKLRYRYLNPVSVRDPAVRQWLVGRTDHDYARHRRPGDAAALARADNRRAILTRAASTGERLTWEEELTQPDGSVRYARRFVQPVRNAAGSLRMLIGYGVDVTEIRRAQYVAEEAARARENFLANMSHEIRTPMNGVLGTAALLSKTPLAPQQRQFVDTIRASGRHLLVLLDDVLDLAKISSGKLTLEVIPFEINGALDTAARTLEAKAAEGGLALLVEPLPEPVWVLGDPHRLNQVLLNLISNAIKFTRQGSVTVRALIHPPAPGSDSATTDLRISLLVEDTGIGIPADKQEAVFNDFEQAYAYTTRRYGGTGLGLAISRALAEQMNGTLRLCSEPGEGTTFAITLTLPRTETPPPEVLLAESSGIVGSGGLLTPAVLPLAGRRVLLVEDHDVNRQMAELLLEYLGATFDSAASGPEALALARTNIYDVILMDIQMPGLSGVDVTTALRADPDPRLANVPIVALTANAFPADRARYLAAGMDDCLVKPFEEADLVSIVNRLVPAQNPALAEPPQMVAPPAAPMGAQPPGAGASDSVLRQRISEAFLRTTPALLEQLRRAAAAGNGAAVATLAHQLLPAVRLLSADPSAADTLRELDGALPAADPAWADAVAYAVQEIEDLLTSLRTNSPA